MSSLMTSFDEAKTLMFNHNSNNDDDDASKSLELSCSNNTILVDVLHNHNSNRRNANNEDDDNFIDKCIDNSRMELIYMITFCLAMGNASDAVEIMCIGFVIGDIKDVTQFEKEFLSSAVFIGMLIGGLLCGYLSDLFGRRPSLLASLGINAVAGLVSSFVPNIKYLILCRIISGLGIGASVPAVFSLGAELFPSKIRGKLLSGIASFWMVGAIFVAMVAWIMLGVKSTYTGWRPFTAVCSIPAFIAFVLVYFIVPESPRFLVNKQKYQDAHEVLSYMTGASIRSDSMSGRQSLSGAVIHGTYSNGNMNDNTMIQLFSKELRKKSYTLMIIWFTLSFGSYGISTWISVLYQDLGISNPYKDDFIYALANFPGNLFSILFIERFGRKRLLCFGMTLAAISSFGFSVGTSSSTTVVLCASLFNALSVVGWNSLDCMSVESFPTNVRTSAMGVLAAAGRIGAIFAQFVNGSLENNIPLLLGVTSTCMLTGGLVSLLLDDTTGDHFVGSSSSSTSGISGNGSTSNYSSSNGNTSSIRSSTGNDLSVSYHNAIHNHNQSQSQS